MGPRKNCWEFKKCGRELGGSKSLDLGVCAASADKKYDGVNGGNRGGRACWLVAGTMCGGKPQGTFTEKYVTCLNCDFFKSVRKEEGREFVMHPQEDSA